jgi:hypothetical protein
VRAPGDGEGQSLARQVNSRLRGAYPNVFRDDTIYEDFDYKDRNPTNYGRAEIEIVRVHPLGYEVSGRSAGLGRPRWAAVQTSVT